MTNLINLLNELYKTNFKMKEDTKKELVWSQTERNQVRSRLIDALIADLNEEFNNSELAEAGLEIKRTADGASINVPNEEWGNFCFSISPKMHSLDYDLDFEAEDYNDHLVAKAEKVAAKAKKKTSKND